MINIINKYKNCYSENLVEKKVNRLVWYSIPLPWKSSDTVSSISNSQSFFICSIKIKFVKSGKSDVFIFSVRYTSHDAKTALAWEKFYEASCQ